MSHRLKILKLGLVDYNEAFQLQKNLREDVILREEPNTIILLEHPPTITCGLRVNTENIFLSNDELQKRGVAVVETNRGGDVTFHGPGQLVIYPIVNLKDLNLTISSYVELLEQTLIDLLSKYGITSGREEKHKGVWIENKKIASIGIHVKHYVSLHGAALNVNTDLNYFKLINPCGLSCQMTSMKEELKKTLSMEELEKLWVEIFCQHTQKEAVWA